MHRIKRKDVRLLIYPENLDQRLKRIAEHSRLGLVRGSYAFTREFSVYGLAGLRRLTENNPGPDKKFFVLCQPRTGSTLLMQLLNNSPEICAEGEIFYLKTLFPFHYARAKSFLSRRPVFGFKMLVDWLTEKQLMDNIPGFITELHKSGWQIIHLQRRSLFYQALSKAVSHKRKVWHHRLEDQQPELSGIEVDWQEVRSRLDTAIQNRRLEHEILASLPHLSLTYEDDLMDSAHHQKAADKVFQYLRVSSVPVKAGFQRICARPLSVLVKNLDEGRRFFGATKYQEICTELFTET